jgi:4,5-dihydroxyphthalate decarboxylase
MLTLKTAIEKRGWNQGLKDGSIRPEGTELDNLDILPQSQAFRQFVPDQKIDIAEIVIGHYLMARDHGKALTAIPVFPIRQFHHSTMVVNATSGVKTPKDLQGKKLAVSSYGVSRGFWARVWLKEQFGVDITKITLVVAEEEALDEFDFPANVEVMPGANLSEMLTNGEIAAAIGVRSESADVKPMFESGGEAEAEWYRKTNVYPINHVLVMRQDLVDQNPDLPEAAFRAWAESKRRWLDALDNGGEIEREDSQVAGYRKLVGPDPLPYGFEPNRHVLEMALDNAVTQGITRKRLQAEDLFAPSTLELKSIER